MSTCRYGILPHDKHPIHDVFIKSNVLFSMVQEQNCVLERTTGIFSYPTTLDPIMRLHGKVRHCFHVLRRQKREGKNDHNGSLLILIRSK